MNLNKVYVCQDVDQRLRFLKARTGLTPNLLCRLGFCLSLREHAPPDLAAYPEDDKSREFNRYTLTGSYDALFVALLTERCLADGLRIPDELAEQFRGHLNRGVILLSQRVKSLADLGLLIPESSSLGLAGQHQLPTMEVQQ